MDLKTLKNYEKDLIFDDENFKRDATFLIKNLPEKLDKKQQKTLNKQLKKLKKGTPLAYVTHKTQFLDFEFFVSKHTLIPRFETELLVDKLIQKFKDTKNLKILDLCCGSGCIGITLQKKLNAGVVCTDINKNCVKTTQKNAELNNANITAIKSNLFEKIDQKFDIIVSNPPYIKTAEIETLDKSVKNFEPKLALDGGDDGLKFYRKIAELSPKFLNKNGILALEIGCDQEQAIKQILSKNFEEVVVEKDYSNLPRFAFAKLKGEKND